MAEGEQTINKVFKTDGKNVLKEFSLRVNSLKHEYIRELLKAKSAKKTNNCFKEKWWQKHFRTVLTAQKLKKATR